MEVLLVLLLFIVPGLLISLNTKVGEIVKALERLNALLAEKEASSRNVPDLLPSASEETASELRQAYRRTQWQSPPKEETPSEQEASVPTAVAVASDQPIFTASSDKETAPVSSIEDNPDTEENENSVNPLVSFFKQRFAKINEDEQPESEGVQDTQEPSAQALSDNPAPEKQPAIALDNAADAPTPAAVSDMTETAAATAPDAEHLASAEVPATSAESENASMDIVAEEGAAAVASAESECAHVAAAEENNFDERVRQLKNWLIYGHAAGCPQDEAPEKLVATTWLLRLGILVIFCTAVFLLRLSIESGLLSPAGRLCLSYLAGAGLLYWGMTRKMRDRYWVLGQTLIGIGLGLFYFSSYAMTAMYHFVTPATAGIIMFLVTLTAGVLSDRLNSIAIAMVAMAGGYSTPLLLATDSHGMIGLCFYLLLLVCGVLWLSYRKKWEQLVWLSMLFTYFLFLLGFADKFLVEEFAGCLFFLALYFILFSTSVFLYNVRNAQEVTALEIISFIANSAFFLLQGMLLISRINHGDRLFYAPLTLGMAFFYLAHAIFFAQRKREAERKLLLAFCALCGVYLAMTAPIVLSGQWLSTAWALQGLLMLWLGVRMESRFLRCCAWFLYILTLGGLCLDFFNYGPLYRNENYGAGFWTGVLARLCQFGIPIACMAYGGKLMLALPKVSPAPADDTSDATLPTQMTLAAGVILNFAFGILLLFLLCECFVDFRFLDGAYRPFALTVVLSGGAFAAFLAWRRNLPGLWPATFVLVLLALLFKCFMADYLFYDVAQHHEYNHIFSWNDTIGNLLNYTTMLTAGYFLQNWLGANEREKNIAQCCRILWPILLFCFSTTELKVILHHTLPGLEVGGVSVLWATFAFAAIYIGVSRGIRPVRYVGLGLFAVVVFKVFCLDLARLDAFWRVCAFLAFGILLIGAAFVYLKYWRNTSEKDSKETEE